MTQASQSSHHSGSPSCCDGRFAHRVGSSGLESLMHGPPTPLPPMNFDGSGGGFSPYTGMPFIVGTESAGNPVSGSMHNQTVLVHSRGHPNSTGVPTSRGAGSESDCRTTPIDSDLESAKSANLVSAYPYHHHAYQQQHHTMSPGRMRGATGSPTHAGLIGELLTCDCIEHAENSTSIFLPLMVRELSNYSYCEIQPHYALNY